MSAQAARQVGGSHSGASSEVGKSEVPLRYIPIDAIFLSGENMRIEATDVDELAEATRKGKVARDLIKAVTAYEAELEESDEA